MPHPFTRAPRPRFENQLRRQGIRHLKSRPQHPQTLGKVERFRKTLWDESLSRTVFSNFEGLSRRLQLYLDGYNFQRPQNREHRAWLALSPAVDDPELERMMRALNELWPRRSLGWESAAAVWHRRRPLRVDRDELRDDVEHRAARLRERLGSRKHARLAGRLAIEQALEDRGLVRRIARGWC